MNENLEFLQALFRNPLSVGAIAPSSPELARKMMEGIEPSEDSIILELGVGTGAVTRIIEEMIPSQDCYLGLELDPKLFERLKSDFPAMNIVQGDACKAREVHRESGLGKVGYIISSLPFVSLPSEVNKAIYGEISEFMAEGCIFRTFQYAHGYYLPPALKLREVMRNQYGYSERSQLVVKNIPPAYTLTWRSPAESQSSQ